MIFTPHLVPVIRLVRSAPT